MDHLYIGNFYNKMKTVSVGHVWVGFMKAPNGNISQNLERSEGIKEADPTSRHNFFYDCHIGRASWRNFPFN